MSETSEDADDIDAIRRRKRKELERKLKQGELGDDRVENTETEGSARSPDTPIQIENEEQFREVISTYELVLVDFHADWCGPCKQLTPIVNTLAEETAATVAKIDIDVNQQLAAQHQVRGVPTLLLFADGDPVERVVGVRGQDELTRLIERHR